MERYPKAPFSGDPEERAYLLGLRAGDIYSCMHGRSIRATVSTTHPAMIQLVRDLFGRYGHVTQSPKFLRKWNQYEWEVYTYLHSSFVFMLQKPNFIAEPFLSFLAGFFDAEGHIEVFKQKGSSTVGIRMDVSSCDVSLLRIIDAKLHAFGYNSHMSTGPLRLKGESVGYGPYGADFWRLSLSRNAEVARLLRTLPLRHSEKVQKRDLAIRYSGRQWSEASAIVRRLRMDLRGAVKESVSEAKQSYLHSHPR